MQQEIDDAKALLDAAREKEATAKAALDTALSNAAAPANNRQRRNARQDYAQMANPNTQTVPDAFQADNALQEAYDTAKEETSAAKYSHDAKVKELDDYKLDHCTTYDDFFEVGIRAVKPIFDDVRRNFLSPNGDYYDLYGAYIAASVVDVTVVGAMNQDQIVDKINDLRKFGFDEFRDAMCMCRFQTPFNASNLLL